MNYAIILSGGVGTRLGLSLPKQYYEVKGKPIIRYVIDTISGCEIVDGFVIVAAVEWQPYLAEQVTEMDKFLGFAIPGKNRQLSVYNGLLYLKELLQNGGTSNSDNQKFSDAFSKHIVLIQDAARPNTSDALIRSCFDLKEDEDGAMPVLPMKDTVYLSKTGRKVDELLNRNQLFAGQAPESFRFEKYLEANEALWPEKILSINGSTEPAILAGMNVKMISGDENNYKITTEADLRKFESLVL